LKKLMAGFRVFVAADRKCIFRSKLSGGKGVLIGNRVVLVAHDVAANLATSWQWQILYARFKRAADASAKHSRTSGAGAFQIFAVLFSPCRAGLMIYLSVG
jgi:hypothetical protein